MARVFFGLRRQLEFFHKLSQISQMNSNELGEMVGISGRSFRNWINGKTLPREDSVRLFSQRFGIAIPEGMELREENWSGRIYGRKAALYRLAQYGPPGTLAGQIKGGKISQLKRKENPEYYRGLGCKVANKFTLPEKSDLLAEFIGIMLGDGGLTPSQGHITLHLHDDEPYSYHVQKLIEDLVGYKSRILQYPYKTARELVVTGVEYVKMLCSFGLLVGNKVKHQVSILAWVKTKESWYKACVRGLFDTDGGTFTHQHIVQGYSYIHFGISFTNASKNLINDFRYYLDIHGIKYGLSGLNVMVYNKPGIKRFFSLVMPNNVKHWNRYKKYIGE